MLTPSHPHPNKPLSRETLLTLIQAALNISENRYARLAALGWLGAYPGDLTVRLLYARALSQEGLLQQALPVLEDLVALDPEFLEAQELLSSTLFLLGSAQTQEIDGHVKALGGKLARSTAVPKWAEPLHASRRMLDPSRPHKQAQFEKGENIQGLIEQIVAENPDGALAAVTHLRILMMDPEHDPSILRSLAQVYYQRWSGNLPIVLIYATHLLEQGEEESALQLLHHAATQDVAGQVPERLWGSQHRYLSLWPESLWMDPGSPSAPQSLPIPASLAAIFGWNQLAMGSQTQDQPPQFAYEAAKISSKGPATAACASRRRYTPPEKLRSARAEVEAVARQIKKPGLANVDGRYPVYLILSSRSGLDRQYGAQNFSQIDLELRALLDTIAHTGKIGALLYYVDDPELSPARPAFNLKPSVPTDPWEIKLAIADLDAALGNQGEMIGAVLIVGGPQIIPFHQLPNPVDDDDPIVNSDNPYSTRDENYFIPEWPVGRIPGDSSKDPAALLKSIRQIITHHRKAHRAQPWHERLWRRISMILNKITHSNPEPAHSMGYSAAIWRRASLSVYRTIGEPRALLVSPPVQIQAACPLPSNGSTQDCRPFPPSRLGYFNLHGLPDTDAWFGQRDPAETQGGPDYPVALRPQDIGKNGNNGLSHAAPEIVFSEACYGANILQKTVEQSISLTFISNGTKAFVGSTCISYGSISTPLIAADLLGRAFWNFLQEGFPAGEALRRAKIYLTREMHNRQGYLDGEDQKTLISFILYGDPLAQASGNGKAMKSTLRAGQTSPFPHTVCERVAPSPVSHTLPPEMTKQVKQIVVDYLPGMQNATVRFSKERAGCQGTDHICPSAQFGSKTLPGAQPNRQVVVLSKKVKQIAYEHTQYARITLDASGKLVKLVVSR